MYVRKTYKRFAKSHFLFFGKIVATEDVPRKPELQCENPLEYSPSLCVEILEFNFNIDMLGA